MLIFSAGVAVPARKKIGAALEATSHRYRITVGQRDGIRLSTAERSWGRSAAKKVPFSNKVNGTGVFLRKRRPDERTACRAAVAAWQPELMLQVLVLLSPLFVSYEIPLERGNVQQATPPIYQTLSSSLCGTAHRP
jgi:hypothetical protein